MPLPSTCAMKLALTPGVDSHMYHSNAPNGIDFFYGPIAHLYKTVCVSLMLFST